MSSVYCGKQNWRHFWNIRWTYNYTS